MDDCRTCGACCVAPHDQTSFCDLTAADYKRLTPHEQRQHVEDVNLQERLAAVLAGREPVPALKTQWRTTKSGPLKGTRVCACVMLRGSVMHRVSCRIYDRRPRACRVAVRPGTAMCRELRRAFEELANG